MKVDRMTVKEVIDELKFMIDQLHKYEPGLKYFMYELGDNKQLYREKTFDTKAW